MAPSEPPPERVAPAKPALERKALGPVARPEGELLAVRVHPRASRNEVVGWQDSALRVRVTAAPDGGEANRAVCRLLAAALGVAPSRVALVRGATTRDKFFRIEGLSLAEVRVKIPLTPTLSPRGRGGSNSLSPPGRGQGEGPA